MKKPLEPKGDYEVGYGKPPKNTRFQPGVSGNPKGRTKGQLDLSTTLTNALQQRVQVIENGRKVSLNKLDLMVRTNVNKAAKGDTRTLLAIVSLLMRCGTGMPAREEAIEPFSSEEQAIMDSFLALNPGMRSNVGEPS